MFEKWRYFQREIDFIESEDLRDFAKYALGLAPDYFWTAPASSSGKYHPKMDLGEGGLVRHTKAVMWFYEENLRLSSYAYQRDEYKDWGRIACLFHDIDKEDYKEHAAAGADFVHDRWFEFFGTPTPELLLMAMRAHMGQWSTHKEDRPYTTLDRAVHLADYYASRQFIDIPEIRDEWENIHAAELDETVFPPEDDLPFYSSFYEDTLPPAYEVEGAEE